MLKISPSKLMPAFTGAAGSVEDRDKVRATPALANCGCSPAGLWNGIATTTDDTHVARALERRGLRPKSRTG